MSKNITISSGTGTADVLNGTYSISVSSTGYDTSTISPSSITVVDGTNSYAFTIAATGSLTVHISEDGTSSGTSVVGAKLIRTDASGNTYGDEITTDSEGNATFSYLPYAESNAPNVYFKQTSSDGNHEFVTSVVTTTLTSQTITYELQNALPAERTFTLTDANYSGLAIDNATITIE